MKKQGLPYLIRKLLLRWKAERKFVMGEDGHLVLHSKALTGGWIGERPPAAPRGGDGLWCAGAGWGCDRGSRARRPPPPTAAHRCAERRLRRAFAVISSAEGTTEVSSYFGYTIRSVMSWEGEMLITSNHVTDPSGCTKVTLSQHWLEGDTLVNETVSETDGAYKVWFNKVVK